MRLAQFCSATGRDDWLLRAVIFDMDGVIVDTMNLHYEAAENILRQHGVNANKKEVAAAGTLSSYEGLKFLSKKSDPEIAKMVEKKYKYLMSKTLGIKPMPGFLEFFYMLKKNNLPVGLFSSSDKIFVRHILTELGILQDFSVVVCGNEVARAKPSPEGYLKAAKALNAMPQESVVIEDSIHGIMAGKAAGMRVVALTSTHERNFLLDADLIVDSLAELSLKKLEALF